MFLILFMYWTTGYFLKNRTDFYLEDELSPVYNMASSGLKKMLDFIMEIMKSNIFFRPEEAIL